MQFFIFFPQPNAEEVLLPLFHVDLCKSKSLSGLQLQNTGLDSIFNLIKQKGFVKSTRLCSTCLRAGASTDTVERLKASNQVM